MCFKKMRLRTIGTLVLALLPVLVSATGGTAGGRERIVDGIVAVVNSRIITLIDVQVVEAFGIVEGSPALPGGGRDLRDVLEKLISQKVVLDLVRGRSTADPARVEAEIERITARLGEEETGRRLARFGIGKDDLRPYVEEKLGVETVIAERFSRSVTVSLDEIETRYRERYLPAEQAAGRTPRPFLETVDVLEGEIRVEKTAAQSNLWVQSLREQAEIEIRPELLIQ